MKRLACLIALGVAGCVAQRTLPPPHPTPSLVEAQPLREESVAAHVEAPDASTLIDELPPDIQKAMSTYLEKGKAPLIRHEPAGFVRFPFGLSQPVVTCKVLSLCDIELEPGEQLSSEHALSLADADRWDAQRIDEGEGATQIQHVVLKPKDDLPLQTDVLIGTTRRLYHIHVISGGKQTINAKFYYPDDELKRFNTRQRQRQDAQQSIVATAFDPTSLHMNYKIECHGARFCPSWVGDDGHRTYLLLPQGLEAIGLPALYIEQAGEQSIVNYNTSKLPYYIVERVFDRAVLQLGTTNNAERVVITREG